jgi:hypothetical protein
MTSPDTNDGTPRRHFVEYDHPDGLYTLEAHRVTKATEGEVNLPGNTTGYAREGQVIVRRGNYAEVHEGKAFDELGLEPQAEQKVLEPYTEDKEPEELFDPSTHTAAEVRRYLRNPELSDEERQRVEDAERDGQNRSSAFPR